MINDELIMIKVIDTNDKLVNEFEDSYNRNREGEYKVKHKADQQILSMVADTSDSALDKLLIVFIFGQNGDEYETEHIYLGTCKVIKGKNTVIYFMINKVIRSRMVIQNILSYSELDLKRDFEKHSYVNVEYTRMLITQIKELLVASQQNMSCEENQFARRDEESYLREYAQHNEHCQRRWYMRKIEGERSEFQRDRERIVNSKAFRRMVDKAQIFTSAKGDHYRTRMTHTLEVAQIARSIANSLKLNIDLTEAIALGHDLGHTPFGHQGERTLDDIVNGRTEVLQKLDFEENNPYGGFKHNFQSLRMLTQLEEKYVEHPGLDVSYQVLEGVLKHTSHKNKECEGCPRKKEKECNGRCCDYAEFVDEHIKEQLYTEYDFATTLEGQVVALADEIAQRGHDIDDAFSSGLLSFDEFQDYMKLSKLRPLDSIIEETYRNVREQEERILIDEQEMLTARVISDIIGYLVNDVVNNSKVKMDDYEATDFYLERHRFDEKLIDFSEEGQEVCLLLEKLISKRAINCLEVTRFDRNASEIVKYLFKAYFDNPKLIHTGTLRRMYIDMRRYTDNVIDFVKGDPKLAKEEFQRIITYDYPEQNETWSDEDKEYYRKRKILIRHIVDLIAGMTDSYAINEYRKLTML